MTEIIDYSETFDKQLLNSILNIMELNCSEIVYRSKGICNNTLVYKKEDRLKMVEDKDRIESFNLFGKSVFKVTNNGYGTGLVVEGAFYSFNKEKDFEKLINNYKQ